MSTVGGGTTVSLNGTIGFDAFTATLAYLEIYHFKVYKYSNKQS
jgi:hypothetical protein